MEEFIHNNSIFLVLSIALIIWFGLAIYLFAIDKKVTNLEKKINRNLNKDLKEII